MRDEAARRGIGDAGLLALMWCLVVVAPAFGRAQFSPPVTAALPAGTQNDGAPTIVVNRAGERVALVSLTPGPCLVYGVACFNVFAQAATGSELEGPVAMTGQRGVANPFLTASPDGTVTAAWTDEAGEIHVADRPARGSFGPSELIASTHLRLGAAELLQDSRGDLMLVVEATLAPLDPGAQLPADGAPPGILVAMRRAGERSFGALQVIPATTASRGLVAAMSDSGDALVAWIDSVGAARPTLRAASCSISTATCAAPLQLPTAAQPELYTLRLAANPAGAFALAWQQAERNGPTDVHVVRGRIAGLSVLARQRLRTRRAAYVEVAIGVDGVTTLVWQHVRASACKCLATIGDVRLVAAAAGSRFRRSVRLSGPGADAPALWPAPSGRAVVSWSEGASMAALVDPLTRRAPRAVRLPGPVGALVFDRRRRPIALWSRSFARSGTGTLIGATVITRSRSRTVATLPFATPSYGYGAKFDAATGPDGATTLGLLLGDGPGYTATRIALTTFHG